MQPIVSDTLDHLGLTEVRFEGSADLRWITSASSVACRRVTSVGSSASADSSTSSHPTWICYLQVVRVPDEKFKDKLGQRHARVRLHRGGGHRQGARGTSEFRDALLSAATDAGIELDDRAAHRRRARRARAKISQRIASDDAVRRISSDRFRASVRAHRTTGRLRQPQGPQAVSRRRRARRSRHGRGGDDGRRHARRAARHARPRRHRTRRCRHARCPRCSRTSRRQSGTAPTCIKPTRRWASPPTTCARRSQPQLTTPARRRRRHDEDRGIHHLGDGRVVGHRCRARAELAAKGATVGIVARRADRLEADPGTVPGAHAAIPHVDGRPVRPRCGRAGRDRRMGARSAALDCLVNNAAVGKRKLVTDHTPDDVDSRLAHQLPVAGPHGH